MCLSMFLHTQEKKKQPHFLFPPYPHELIKLDTGGIILVFTRTDSSPQTPSYRPPHPLSFRGTRQKRARPGSSIPSPYDTVQTME
jgi:hypothetical protein